MVKAKTEKKSFETKMRELDESFVEGVLEADPSTLNRKLAELTKAGFDLEEKKENDLALKKAKDRYQEAGATYKETSKTLRMKKKYIVNLLKSKE